MITDSQFRKLLAKKGRLQDEYGKLNSRRTRLLEQIEDLEDDLSALELDIADISREMLE